MSRALEEAHERWFKTHLEECERDLIVGARVYRVGYDSVEEGKVSRVCRARRLGWNNLREDPNGSIVQYHACFGAGAWESQTYQYIFFYRREDAQKKLAEKLRDRAKDCRRDADKWDALAAAQEAP